MRLKAGDPIAVFDGRGGEWRARIVSVSRGDVRLSVTEPIVPAREPRIPIRLLQAVLKGDHMDAVVRDATMMGVAAIAPIVSARTIARAGAQAAERAVERWQRVALASVKQCRRAVLPAIAAPVPLQEALLEVERKGKQDGLSIVLTEPSTGAQAKTPAEFAPPREAVLASGPEGGWSGDELATFLAAGFAPLSLGPMTLRADAAALVAISMLRASWRDM
jgi:16S rRNA (uracil1498-N3)-methyltransferase